MRLVMLVLFDDLGWWIELLTNLLRNNVHIRKTCSDMNPTGKGSAWGKLVPSHYVQSLCAACSRQSYEKASAKTARIHSCRSKAFHIEGLNTKSYCFGDCALFFFLSFFLGIGCCRNNSYFSCTVLFKTSNACFLIDENWQG